MSLTRVPYGYSKLDNEDPEEMVHRRAQFLVYKVLQQADTRPRRASFIRIRLSKLRVKIGRKLKILRKSMLLTVSSARAIVHKQVSSLFSGGKAIGNLPCHVFS